MKTTRNFTGLFFAGLPILLIGGALLYLNNVRNAFGGLLDAHMGPTMIGLAVIGLVCVVTFLLKLRKLSTPPAPPQDRVGDRVDAALAEAKSDFDADAAFARYMARREAGGIAPPPASSGFGNAPFRPAGSFGRKGA